MTIDTSEKQFENNIEQTLLDGGYIKRKSSDFDYKNTQDSQLFIEFLKDTQPEKWEKLEESYGSSVEEIVIKKLTDSIKDISLIQTIRRGFSIYDVHIDCAYPKPVSGNNPDALKLYENNRLSIIRQARYNEDGKAVDLLLCLNGLSVATGEIKNPLTGQTFEDAKKQYMEDRDPKEPLFSFKTGALVHFAIDPEEIHMTTRLNKDKTVFLPFNKGRNEGSGNPDNPKGYRTSYLWENIWQKDTWIDIIENYVGLQKIPQKTPLPPKEALIFPRYHQLETVTELTQATRREGPGNNYLIQHSTGSGKSNTIAWLAYNLFSLHNDQDTPMFDSILVISDRIGIVNQLGDTIMQFEQTPGVVLEVENSKQLTENLGEGKKILVSTQQKFPFVLEEIRKRKGKHFAIIIDEAHSSQSGDTAFKVKKVLTADLEEAAREEEKIESERKDIVDQIHKEMQERGPQENLSYYAFTATPKKITLELFGRQDESRQYRPFHTYSMKQAIQEGFILDVLKNYTTFETYFHIVKTTPEDKTVEGKKASRALMKYVETHHKSVSVKAELIVEHFRKHVMYKIGGLAKAMVVASSRLEGFRYKQEIDEYISKNKIAGIKTIFAFSGSIRDEDGTVYTEQNINDTKTEEELREKFDTSEFNILIVAEKYQTGFDQPLLHTMYVDKPLHGVKVVQTLSRLNRTNPGKTETFVLDFKNNVIEIQKSYEPYYKTTMLVDKTSPDFLFKLCDEILSFGIITQNDLDEFSKVFFGEKDKSVQQGLLYAKLDPVLDRFIERGETKQEEFKAKLRKYIEGYSFLSQVIRYSEVNLEKLFVLSKYLINTRPFRTLGTLIPELKGDVSLDWYRLEKTHEGDISLGRGTEPLELTDKFGMARPPEVLTSLSEIIRKINEIFGGKFIDADIITIQDWQKILENMPDLRAMAQANEFSDFARVFEKRFEQVMIENMDQNTALVTRIFTNSELRQQITIAAAEFYHKWAKANNLPPITPANPWENRSNFRQAIRSCKGHIYWIDRYFGYDGLDFLMNGIDQNSVNEVKILTSLYKNENQINQRLHDEFKMLQEEMKRKGINIELRLISTKELYHKVAHDRYIIGENVKYNVPSIDTVIRGQLSEIKRTTADVPFLEWWNNKDSIDLIRDWQQILSLSTFEAKCDRCGKIERFPNYLKGRRPLYCKDCFAKFRK